MDQFELFFYLGGGLLPCSFLHSLVRSTGCDVIGQWEIVREIRRQTTTVHVINLLEVWSLTSRSSDCWLESPLYFLYKCGRGLQFLTSIAPI